MTTERLPTLPTLPSHAQLFDEMPCGLLVLAPSGLILRANRTFCTWVGIPVDDLVHRHKLQELLTMGGRIFHQTHWLPMMEMQGSLAEVKLEMKGPGGITFAVLLNAVRRHGEGGSYDEVSVVVAQDRHQYERELLDARRRADELLEKERIQAERVREAAEDRALLAEQMVGIVSHDLRSPLQTIFLSSQALARGGVADAERSARMLDSIDRASRRAGRLIAELLDFTAARVGQGVAVQRRAVDIHAVVAAVMEELAVAHPGHTLAHQASGPGQALADADRIAQVVSNLVGNAVAYGDAGRPITVTSQVDDGDGHVTLAVHNFGEPIPSERLKDVFEPMVRHSELGGSGRSVGLGLFIVRAIAQAHGGEISVTSSRQQGTAFVMRFPGKLAI